MALMVSSTSDRCVLVTGGAGYIGSHTCKALAQAGYLPVTFDNLSSGHDWAVKWGPLSVGDIHDRMALVSAIKRFHPLAVIHFAGSAYVGESVVDPGKYYRNNVAGSLTLLEALRDYGIRSIVFSSTCATYGVPESLPIREGAEQDPVNPYGASKLMIERMLADFGAAHEIKSVSLRYFNAAGADPDNEIGEDHDPETHLIPLILDAASGRRPNVTVFGSDYDTPDGTCVRDFIHVSDLAQAHVLALDALQADSSRARAYNLGVGCGYSVREVIDGVEKITALKVPVVLSVRRPGDPAALVGDSTKACEELGWQPKFGLSDIIRTAWAWHQRRAIATATSTSAEPARTGSRF
jgi:UDP-arabinose 4-epimerase